MKRISIPISIHIDFTAETLKSTREIWHDFWENVRAVIFTASDIENQIARGIAKYFFGDNETKMDAIDNLIISTDSFSFSSKRKAFLTIVKEQKIIVGAGFSDLERSISKIIKYRNMFTHGKFKFLEDGCTVCYFEGIQREQTITDDFLNAVETEFKNCYYKISEIIEQIEQI